MLGKLITLYELGRLTPEEERRFEIHLLECDHCFREFSGMAAAMTAFREVAGKRSIQESLNANELEGASIVLSPVTVEIPPCSQEQTPALAAKGDADISMFTLLGEFISTDRTIFLRLLKQTKTGEIICYLLSEDPQKTCNAVLEIGGLRRTFFTDEKGIVRIGKDPGIDLSSANISVRTPLTTFHLVMHERSIGDAVMETKIPLESEEHDRIILSIEERKMGKCLKIEIEKIRSGSGKKNLHVMVRKENGERLFSEAREGIAVFEGLEHEKQLTISVFK
jgi:hypothetical protein